MWKAFALVGFVCIIGYWLQCALNEQASLRADRDALRVALEREKQYLDRALLRRLCQDILAPCDPEMTCEEWHTLIVEEVQRIQYAIDQKII